MNRDTATNWLFLLIIICLTLTYVIQSDKIILQSTDAVTRAIAPER